MQRYFIDSSSAIVNLDNQKIIMISDDAHHIKNVMRNKVGDKIIVCYDHKSYLCAIETMTNKEVELEIVQELQEDKELSVEVTIAHGLVRKEKMEEVIDHITELGADYYLPVIMKRSNVKISSEKLENKLTRLNKIAKEAAEQAHRTRKLEVFEPISFNVLLEYSKNYDLCLVAHVGDHPSMYIANALNESCHKILVLVGPEGGIDPDELKLLKTHHFIQVNLGRRVLRTEVAPSYIMSIIDMIRGNNNEI